MLDRVDLRYVTLNHMLSLIRATLVLKVVNHIHSLGIGVILNPNPVPPNQFSSDRYTPTKHYREHN